MTRTDDVGTFQWPSSRPRRRTLSLVILAVLALAAGWLLEQPVAPRPLVALAGAVLAFGLPGLALTRAMFPGPGMGRAERVVLVIGLQLGLVIMCGFLLHLLRPGLSAASWGAILADVTLIACAVAWLRGRGLTGQDGQARSRLLVAQPGWLAAFSNASTSQLAMLIGAVLIAAIALAVARAGVALQPQPAWTALAIEAADGGRQVALDVTNAEGRSETYRLVATIDGEPLTTVVGLTVADGASTTQVIPLPAAGAFLRQVDVSLWRSSDPPDQAPYRSVRLSLRGVPGP